MMFLFILFVYQVPNYEYKLTIVDRCGIDLPKAALRKLELNAKKYPADKVRGSSKKYNEY